MPRRRASFPALQQDDDAVGASRTKGKRVVSPSPSPSVKKKKKKKEGEEKRLARFVAQPSSAVLERIGRAFTHRLYLIEKKLIGDPDAPSACEFFVLGATGNVYTVKLEIIPSCTCPDYGRGHSCKHVLFVMLRVLKLPRNDPRVWQKALLSSELNGLLHVSSVDNAVLASQRVRQRFKEITGRDEDEENKNDQTKTVQRDVDADCPICYERMAGNDGQPLEPVVFCQVCGNNVHKDCFKRWGQSKGRAEVTCIYCRALWQDDTKDRNSAGGNIKGGYVNLASYSDVHGTEDTSLSALYPESYQWCQRT